MDLPGSGPKQTYVTVSAIDRGSLTLPEDRIVSPASSERHTVPSLSFLVTHLRGQSPNTEPLRVLFDLGMRVSEEGYTPEQRAHLRTRQPAQLGPGVAKELADQGIKPENIETIIFSHVHYDHTGDPQHFPTSRFVVGPGSCDVLRDGLPGKGSHRSFDSKLLPPERTSELPSMHGADGPSAWKPLGESLALDYFEDGSVYVLDAPGHLPGHISLLCRTSESSWVCLCGDSYHDVRLRTGERQIATWEGADDQGVHHEHCIHLDRPTAEKHIEKLRRLAEMPGVEVIAAHDLGWLTRNQHRMFPKPL